jgi:prepilin peptidase CpaA
MPGAVAEGQTPLLSPVHWVLATDLVLGATLLISAWTDLKSRLIYDKLTIPAALLGLALQGAFFGWGESLFDPGLSSALAGMASAFLIYGLFWLTGGMGAGDLKLVTAVGALLGCPDVFGALLAGSLAGGVQGLLALAARTGPGRRVCARLGITGTDDPEFGRSVPLGVGLALGVALFRIAVRTSLLAPPPIPPGA